MCACEKRWRKISLSRLRFCEFSATKKTSPNMTLKWKELKFPSLLFPQWKTWRLQMEEQQKLRCEVDGAKGRRKLLVFPSHWLTFFAKESRAAGLLGWRYLASVGRFNERKSSMALSTLLSQLLAQFAWVCGWGAFGSDLNRQGDFTWPKDLKIPSEVVELRFHVLNEPRQVALNWITRKQSF